MVTLSERAAQKVRELLEAEGDPSLTSLRVAVEGGGCSGFQYAIGFDTGAEPDDLEVESHGVRVVVDPISLPYLAGSTIDYSDGRYITLVAERTVNQEVNDFRSELRSATDDTLSPERMSRMSRGMRFSRLDGSPWPSLVGSPRT